MDRQARLRQLRERAEANRRAVQDACPVPIVMRESLGVLDPGSEGPRYDSADMRARVDVGGARSLDLGALEGAAFDGSASWFEVASLVLENYPPPLEDTDSVWVSEMGSLYHRYDDCEVMWNGKRAARDEGMKVHPVVPMTLAKAREARGGYGHKLTPCKTCI